MILPAAQRFSMIARFLSSAATALLFVTSALAAEWKFDFSSEKPAADFVAVPSTLAFDAARGFGYLGATQASAPGQPVVFAVAAPEGNYDVTVRFGRVDRATSTTLKAESRRLIVEKVETAPGQFVTRSFTLNVRRPAISTGGVTMLNSREQGPPVVPDWDEYLSLEINGRSPGVAAIEIRPSTRAITVFVAGDSTVTDQAREPYAGWAQMLPRFFRAGVAISNQAESGLALFSFERQKRLEKVLSMMHPGDYLFIQFGHNDQKDKRPEAGPFTTYKANLGRFIVAARGKGGLPVLVTPMERRRFDAAGQPQPTLADYAAAVRQVGAEQRVPVIDLHALSLQLYAALGPEKSTRAFVFYPAGAFPGQEKRLEDNTHHNAYGAYELARCIVEGIRSQVPALAAYLAEDARPFDPRNPDAPETIDIPASPLAGPPEKPAGN